MYFDLFIHYLQFHFLHRHADVMEVSLQIKNDEYVYIQLSENKKRRREGEKERWGKGGRQTDRFINR